MNNNYGKLLEYSAKEQIEDPYKGYKTVRRGSATPGNASTYQFEAPEETMLLSMKHSRFIFDLELESNIIPDNDIYARMIKRLEMSVNDVRVTFAGDDRETAFLAQYSTMLNFTKEAQESEMFLQGRFDSTAHDFEELMNETIRYSGKNVVDHRQSFAHVDWIQDYSKHINIGNNENIPFSKKIFKWRMRAPIPHGIAKQLKVIPIDTKVVIDLRIGEKELFLIEHEAHMAVRIRMSDFGKINYPWVDPKLEIVRVEDVEHLTFEECDCNDWKKCISIEQIAGTADESVVTGVAERLKAWTKEAGFVAHQVTLETVRCEEYYDEQNQPDNNYIVVFYENPMDRISNFMKNFELEANLIKSPRKIQSPLIVKKGICKIPFLNSRLFVSSFPTGMRMYEQRLSHGRLPHMAIFTGQSMTRYNAEDAKTCPVKTALYESGFEIEEFTILVNDVPIMGTPWNTAEQFYENYLRQIGRMDNFANSGSLDYFEFIENNFIVPMHFDEHDNLVGQLSVKIKFKTPLVEAWKPIYMVVSTMDLEIDTPKRCKNSFFK